MLVIPISWITTNLDAHLERFRCGGPIDRSQLDHGSDLGSGRYVGEISLDVGVLRVAGRHAIYKLSVFDSAAARSRRDDSAQWKRNTTRSVSCESFPGPHACTRTRPKGRRARVTDDHREAHDLISRVYTGGMTSSRVAAGC